MESTPDIITKLTQWLCFTVIISLLPLAFSLFRLSKQGEIKSNKKIIDTVLGKGDILIVSVAIVGDAIGEIISNTKDISIILQMIVATICVVLIAFLSYCYAEFSAQTSPAEEEIQFAVKTSLNLFIASVIISGICKALTN